MPHLHTEIAIAAPPETVWAVLMDFGSYQEWNPFVTSISGEAVIDGPLEVTLSLPGGKTMSFEPTVTELEPERSLEWLGKVMARGIFDGRHSFSLTPIETGTRFEQSERFTGLLGWMMSGSMRRRTETGFRAMNEALRTRCES